MSNIVRMRPANSSPSPVRTIRDYSGLELMHGWEASDSPLLPSEAASATDWGPSLTGVLNEIVTQCLEPGWDGDGSVAVNKATILMAKQVVESLRRLLPASVPFPDVDAQSNGHIGVSWILGAKQMFWLSVDAAGRIHFTGLFGTQGADHGWRRLNFSSRVALDHALSSIAEHVQKLFPVPAEQRAA